MPGSTDSSSDRCNESTREARQQEHLTLNQINHLDELVAQRSVPLSKKIQLYKIHRPWRPKDADYKLIRKRDCFACLPVVLRPAALLSRSSQWLCGGLTGPLLTAALGNSTRPAQSSALLFLKGTTFPANPAAWSAVLSDADVCFVPSNSCRLERQPQPRLFSRAGKRLFRIPLGDKARMVVSRPPVPLGTR